MTDDKFELTRRRVLGGIVTIGAAGAATGAGTMALFSDTETSSGNTIQAGTLDLTLGDSGNAPLSVTNVSPGDSGSAILQVNNEGSIEGSLDVIISDIVPTDADPEPEQSLDDKRRFTTYYGTDNDSPSNYISLPGDLGWEPVTVDIDLSGDPYVFTADLPYALVPGNDSITFAFDSDNDGIEDFQLAVRDYDSDGSLEGVYDDGSALPSGSRSRNESLPSGYDARIENGNKRFIAEVPSTDLSDPFAITGQANLASYNPPTDGSNLALPLIPGFGYNNPPIAGTSAWDGHATKMVEIKSDELRTLADMLDLTIYISQDSSRSNDDTFVSSGKVNRLPMVDAEPNETLSPNGGTKYVIVEYELSPNVGNGVQNDEVTFDIKATLNQKDSQ